MLIERHGGDVERFARLCGRPAETLLDFSSNINPLGMPDAARNALIAAVDTLGRYPDPTCAELRRVIGERLDVDPARIIAGNGAEQLIWWLPRVLESRRVVVTAPCYLDYERSARVWSVPVAVLDLIEEECYRLQPQRLASLVRDGDLVWIGQPNNPTGTLVDAASLRQVVAAHPMVDWAIDEAFIDFVEQGETAVGWGLPNLVVLRSMTKFYALAGLRLGYAVTTTARAAQYARLLPEWSVNLFASTAGIAVLEDARRQEFVARTLSLVSTERQRLSQRLRDLGCHVYEGAANYLLLRLRDDHPPGAGVARRLLAEYGIAVRVCDNYRALDTRHLRIAVRNATDNQQLLAALAELFRAAPAG